MTASTRKTANKSICGQSLTTVERCVRTCAPVQVRMFSTIFVIDVDKSEGLDTFV